MRSQFTNIESLLTRLSKESSCYYIEQKEIATKISSSGHTFYSRYKKCDGKVTSTLIQQHISKEINLAIPLDKNSLIFSYAGEHLIVFASLLFHIAKEFAINNLLITTHTQEEIEILLLKNEYNCNTINDFLEKLSRVLQAKLPNEWQIFPQKGRPEIGNLLTLPREIIELNAI